MQDVNQFIPSEVAQMMTGNMVIGDEEFAIGVNLHFSLSGGVRPEQLEASVKACGLDVPTPKRSRPEEALRRALDRLRDRSTLRRSTSRKSHEVVVEVENGGTLTYPENRRLKAAIGENKVPVFEPADHPAVETVMNDFAYFSTHITSDDVHAWFLARLHEIGAVHKVQRGNFYFVPKESIAKLEQLKNALSITSSSFDQEPVAKSDGAVRWVLKALTAEAAEQDEAIREDLEKGVGKRALENRIKSVDATKQKLAMYEELLGQALPVVQSKLESLRTNLVFAAFEAEAESA